LFCTVAKNRLDAFGARIVVDAGGVDLEHLAPEDFLGRADVADTFEQLVEVVPSSALQPLVVHGETLDDVVLQATGRPLAKLGAAMRSDPVAHGDDHR